VKQQLNQSTPDAHAVSTHCNNGGCVSVAAGMSHTRKQEVDLQSVGPKCMSIDQLHTRESMHGMYDVTSGCSFAARKVLW